jgi:hypothetical protein
LLGGLSLTGSGVIKQLLDAIANRSLVNYQSLSLAETSLKLRVVQHVKHITQSMMLDYRCTFLSHLTDLAQNFH